MEVVRKIILPLALFLSSVAVAQNGNPTLSLEYIIQDIYESLLENEKDIDFESLTQHLQSLAESPININSATQEQLESIPFLSEEQIDAILLYAYRRPFHSLYELQLIPNLKSYEIRNLLPFVCVEPTRKEEPVYWKENFRHAKHQLILRSDMRNIEGSEQDPYYLSLKYFLNTKRLQFACTMERDAGEPWWGKKTYGFDFYGGFLQWNKLTPHMDKWIIGDFRANFGQGLVVNNTSYLSGKQVSAIGRTNEGIKHHRSTQEYNFFRGTAAVFHIGNVELSALYSARRIDAAVKEDGTFPTVITTGYHRTPSELHSKQSVWQHTIIANASYRYKQLKLGLTLQENLFNIPIQPIPTYYNANYFRGKNQFAVGINYRWNFRRFCLFGEVATAQNRRWGVANITGVRIAPINDLTLVAVYRFYSPKYDVFNANALGETSRNNDESGVYLGTEVTLVPKWRFSAYADVFSFQFPKYGVKTPSTGYEALCQADFNASDALSMQWRMRAKQKGEDSRYSLRYHVNWQTGEWLFRTQIESNLSGKEQEKQLHFGVLFAENCSYQFRKVPILLQLRLQAFYAPDYLNRFFAYENDVLYAFSIPSVYGIGARYYLNIRYKINAHWAIYCRASQTVYASQWVKQQQLAHNRITDLHLLLRMTY